ncbi:ABC transporter ATP-binding protein [Variovorax sp. H27-G14]
MAKAIDAMSHGGLEAGQSVMAFAMVYLLLRFMGEAIADVRWIVINPVLYRVSFAFCSLIAGRIAKIPRREGRGGDASAWVAEKTSIISKMEMGCIGFLHGLLAVIIPTLIQLTVACVAIGISIGPMLVAYIVVGGLVFMIGVSFKRDKELSAANDANQADNMTASFFSEYISNPGLVREFNAGAFLEARLSRSVEAALDKYRRFFSIKTERGLYQTGITCVIYGAVMAGAVFQMGLVSSTAGSFFLLVIYLDRILGPLSSASLAINSMQNGLIAIKGGYDLLADMEKSGAQAPFSISRANEWEHILFDQSPDYFLRAKTLTIGKGSWICVKGPSGVGKSTHLKKINHEILGLGLFQPTKTHYLNPAPATIRGSVFENISLGDETIGKERVNGYWYFWSRKLGNSPVDIDSDVGSLSAGEAQFLAICRILVRAPELVFFDEATNSMDRSSESKTWELIRRELRCATVFVVTHRDIKGIEFDFVDILGNEEKIGNSALATA